MQGLHASKYLLYVVKWSAFLLPAAAFAVSAAACGPILALVEGQGTG
jgi:hypothetical protein